MTTLRQAAQGELKDRYGIERADNPLAIMYHLTRFEIMDHVQMKAALSTAKPEIKGVISDAVAAGVPWLQIVQALMQHAGDLKAIYDAVVALINQVAPHANPAPFPAPTPGQ